MAPCQQYHESRSRVVHFGKYQKQKQPDRTGGTKEAAEMEDFKKFFFQSLVDYGPELVWWLMKRIKEAREQSIVCLYRGGITYSMNTEDSHEYLFHIREFVQDIDQILLHLQHLQHQGQRQLDQVCLSLQ